MAIKQIEKITLTKHLSVMIKAGISLAEALGSLSNQSNSTEVKKVLTQIKNKIVMGFDSAAYLPGLKKFDETIIRLGINEHYNSISRGVVDIRDVLYFVSVVAIFNESTRMVLLSRHWKRKN